MAREPRNAKVPWRRLRADWHRSRQSLDGWLCQEWLAAGDHQKVLECAPVVRHCCDLEKSDNGSFASARQRRSKGPGACRTPPAGPHAATWKLRMREAACQTGGANSRMQSLRPDGVITRSWLAAAGRTGAQPLRGHPTYASDLYNGIFAAKWVRPICISSRVIHPALTIH